MPLNHLIPRIPQRINYVLWIEDLIKKSVQAYGIDIGISYIYLCKIQEDPLL